MRVYYHLEEAGRKHLDGLKEEYCTITRGIFYILGIADLETLEKWGGAKNETTAD